MELTIPELALVVLIGPSGSGKSTFARTHFKSTEIVSSDVCRGMLSDDENDQTVTKDAFDLVHYVIRQRLRLGRLTVVDATNVQTEARKPLIAIAREFHALPVAVLFKTNERVCSDRNQQRTDRDFGHRVIRNQISQMKRGLRNLKREGFRHIFTINDEEAANAATIIRQPLWNNRKDESGPFDIVGDVHGCYDELCDLIAQLGYTLETESSDSTTGPRLSHPNGRKLVFVGDLVDRGPKTVEVLKLAMRNVAESTAICVPGNHDSKLLRKLRGRDVQITHGLAETLEQLESTTDNFKAAVASFLDGLVSHYVFDRGRLVVAHAGMKESMMGRGSRAVREFALYGETTGETDEFGLPIRYNWAAEYRGDAHIVYGHTPIPEPEWLNKTINLDTGCVFGGKLTALRYPEMELVSVPARHTYAESRKPFLAPDEQAPVLSEQQKLDDVLDLSDVIGKRIISTRLRANLTIREENANAALEIMSRYAINPKWLIHLPPTMSPCETSARADYLEYPEEAFSYFRSQGVPRVICEEKHMGSRAIVVLCRDEDAARTRFGIEGEGIGAIYTRTGRRFINDPNFEAQLLARLCAAATAANWWETFQTDWICLDCELMPWSWKARELLVSQYAATGAAARAFTKSATAALQSVAPDASEAQALLAEISQREADVGAYVDAYRQYCWEAKAVTDLKLAPFHILSTEGRVHVDQTNAWHMETIAGLCEYDPEVLLATKSLQVDVTDEASIAAGCDWWLNHTSAGGEGMVVKPLDFIARGQRGLLQPAVKCRGREYLRIIYVPEYTQPENLDRLRNRGLRAKRSLALREFALGIESLERFVRREPLRRVHECVFGVLALESEPVDPRL